MRIDPLYNMWELVNNWRTEKDRWFISKFDKLNVEEVQEFINHSIKVEQELRENNVIYNCNSTINILDQLGKEMQECNTRYLPILTQLTSPFIKHKHWKVLQ